MSDFYVKLHKWADNIDHMMYEWAEAAVMEHWEVDDVLDLDVFQIQELEAWVDLNSDTGYDHALIGFRNIINYWENEKVVDD